jgi:outer membrane protein assembly factor BamA
MNIKAIVTMNVQEGQRLKIQKINVKILIAVVIILIMNKIIV